VTGCRAARKTRLLERESSLVRLLLLGGAKRKFVLMNHYFNRLAEQSARALGSAWAFVAAVTIVLLWAVSGPAFHYNDTWQLTINTGTTIVTFLMVFLIQNSQNRDARANQLKIDELLRAVEQARTSMVNLQDLTEPELAALEAEFRKLGRAPGVAVASAAQDLKNALVDSRPTE
jgi:low affinity Fe/Cu permease